MQRQNPHEGEGEDANRANDEEMATVFEFLRQLQMPNDSKCPSDTQPNPTHLFLKESVTSGQPRRRHQPPKYQPMV